MHSVLPWDWYRDPRVLAVEERRLFRPSWQYVGPLECLQRPGDQMVGRLLRVPVVVVRDGDGELRGFLNVCRHRGSLVVPADGNAPRLRCPYHAWTYGLDGTLRSAPQCGPEIAAELADLGLLPVRVATFGPFVFASAAADGPPLEAVIGDLAEVVAGVGLDLGGLRRRQRFDYTLAANWKIHLENYLECYHCPVAHPGFSAVMDVGPGRYELTAGTHRLSHRAPVRRAAGPAADRLPPGRRQRHRGQLSPAAAQREDQHQPRQAEPVHRPCLSRRDRRTAGFLDYYFGADADEAWIEQMMAFDTEVGDQDAALVAAAQAGVAGSWIDRGRILPQERLLADFQRYVYAACAGEVAPG